MNAIALTALIEKHGVKLRRLPDTIVAAARAAAPEIMAQFRKAGGIDGRIGQSYADMQKALGQWPMVSAGGFLEARDRA